MEELRVQATTTTPGIAMTTLVTASLARALRRYAGRDEHEDDGLDEQEQLELAVGVVMGTRRVHDEDTEPPQLAVWGILKTTEAAATMATLLPPGVQPVARFAVLSGSAGRSEEAVAEYAAKALAMNIQAPSDAVLLLLKATKQLRLYAATSDGVKRVDLQEIDGYRAREFLKASGSTMARCAVDVDAFGVNDALEQLEKWTRTLGDASNVFARVGGRSTSVFDASGTDVVSDRRVGSPPTIGELLGLDAVAVETKPKSKKKGKKSSQRDAWGEPTSSSKAVEGDDGAPGFLPTFEYGGVANIELLTSLSTDQGSSPVLTVPTSTSASDRRWQLHLDVLVVLPVDATVSSTLSLIRRGLLQQVDELVTYVRRSTDSSPSIVSFEHFPLVGACFPLTIATSSDGLVAAPGRPSEIHAAFFQPTDRPLLDVTRGCSLASQALVISASDVLFNVHEGLPASGISRSPDESQDEQCVLVDGSYGYFHYLQQGVRDKGWGCAYRSLQTLSSWLQLSHYTLDAPPSHTQIQRALVRLGDKPAAFVGSTEWIGSLEVGYALDELFGISFRSLSVPSGSKLPELARELQHHFSTHGTPVMMGGGQLAFTILGVDYDPKSGDCALLVLDPHYTGVEDLDVIQSKMQTLEGYKAVACSWRRTSSFSAKSFYNLCLPQRPTYTLD